MPSRKAPKGCYWRGQVLWGRTQIRGRIIRWSLETDDARIAKGRRAAGTARLIADRHGDARRTIEEVIDAWRPWIKHQVGPNTVTRYAVSLGQLDPFLAGKYLDEINARLIADIVRTRHAVDNVTNATVKRDLGAMSSVVNFAIDQGWREDNPVLARLRRLKERRDPIVLPRPEDIATLIGEAPGMLASLIKAARATGCRQDELARARCAQLDLKAKRLTVIGKGNRLRVIDLDPFDGMAVFAALPAGIGRAPIFRTERGSRFANLASRITTLMRRIAAKDAGFIRFRFHDLRHLHAVEWLRSGRSIYDLQQRLGHRSIKTTEVYLQYLTPEEKRVAMGIATATKAATAKAANEDEALDR